MQTAEEDLSAEKRESGRLRTYLSQILAQVQAKAPLIDQQRQDYERAVLSYEEAAKRLDVALRESAELASSLAAEKDARAAAEQQVASLRAEVQVSSSERRRLFSGRLFTSITHVPSSCPGFRMQDLARQLKVLLHRQQSSSSFGRSSLGGSGLSFGGSFVAGGSAAVTAADLGDEQLVLRLSSTTEGGPSGGDVDAPPGSSGFEEHLLTYSSVDEMQTRNQQLVRVVRTLVRQLQKAGGALGLPEDAAATLKAGTPVAAAAALRRMQSELEELRVARERQEAIVGTLVQQRDMYRILLLQQQGGSGGGGTHPQQQHQQEQQQHQPRVVGSPAPVGVTLEQLQQQRGTTGDGGQQSTSSEGQQQAAAQVAALESLLEANRAEVARLREDAQSRIATLDAAVTSARDELLSARTELATAQAEARFFRDRVDALKGAEAAARSDAAREAKRCSEVQVCQEQARRSVHAA
jgi:hypothetical protein